jgi:hypothetical protein
MKAGRVGTRIGNLHSTTHQATAAMGRITRPTDELLLHDEGDAAQVRGPVQRICHVCQRARAQYTCPRCQAPYCTVDCYKAHSGSCTEAFYRDQVLEGLKEQQPGEEERERVAGMLSTDAAARVEDAEMLDPISNPSVGALEAAAELLARGDLDPDAVVAQVLAVLTKEQQQSFLRAAADGRLAAEAELVPWAPWWDAPAGATAAGGAPKVVELLEGSGGSRASDPAEPPAEAASAAGPPALPTVGSIPALASLMGSRAPSPALRFHLCELLYAYAYVKRLYNGDWGRTTQEAREVAQCLLALSAVIVDPAARLDGVAHACHGALSRAQSPLVHDSPGFSVSVLASVAALLRIPDASLRCVHEMHQTLERACGRPTEDTCGKVKRVERRRLEAARRKLWFFVVWCSDRTAAPALGAEATQAEEWAAMALEVEAVALEARAVAERPRDAPRPADRPAVDEVREPLGGRLGEVPEDPAAAGSARAEKAAAAREKDTTVERASAKLASAKRATAGKEAAAQAAADERTAIAPTPAPAPALPSTLPLRSAVTGVQFSWPPAAVVVTPAAAMESSPAPELAVTPGGATAATEGNPWLAKAACRRDRLQRKTS